MNYFRRAAKAISEAIGLDSIQNYGEEGDMLVCPPAPKRTRKPVMDSPLGGFGVAGKASEGASPLSGWMEKTLLKYEVEIGFLEELIRGSQAGYNQVKSRGFVLEPEDQVLRLEQTLRLLELAHVLLKAMMDAELTSKSDVKA
jgi:hypothetical protein